MARLLRELVRRQSSSGSFIAGITHRDPPKCSLYPPLISGLNPSEKGLWAEEEEIAQISKLQIYPSFSIGGFLNPILHPGLAQCQLISPVGVEAEHPGMIWADSVKKKRKKKMNKHKYKKLRKRLRRKTKT